MAEKKAAKKAPAKKAAAKETAPARAEKSKPAMKAMPVGVQGNATQHPVPPEGFEHVAYTDENVQTIP